MLPNHHAVGFGGHDVVQGICPDRSCWEGYQGSQDRNAHKRGGNHEVAHYRSLECPAAQHAASSTLGCLTPHHSHGWSRGESGPVPWGPCKSVPACTPGTTHGSSGFDHTNAKLAPYPTSSNSSNKGPGGLHETPHAPATQLQPLQQPNHAATRPHHAPAAHLMNALRLLSGGLATAHCTPTATDH
jgi:hypothetical protein